MNRTCTFYSDEEIDDVENVKEEIKIAALAAIYLGYTKFMIFDETSFDKLVLPTLLEIQDHPMGMVFTIQIANTKNQTELLENTNLSIIYSKNNTFPFKRNKFKHIINTYKKH